MKHLFVPYEIAKILEEKGFDEKCIAHHVFEQPNNNYVFQVGCYFYREVKPNYTLAPLYQQVVDWFLDKHKIYITEKANTLLTHFSCKVWKSERIGDTANQQGKWTETYPYGLSRYEALDMAIKDALKLI